MGNKVGKKQKKLKIKGDKELLYSYHSSIEELDAMFHTVAAEVSEKEPKEEENKDSERYRKVPNSNVLQNTVITPLNSSEESQISKPTQENVLNTPEESQMSKPSQENVLNTPEESQISKPSQENPIKSDDTSIERHDKSIQTDSDWLDTYIKERMETQDSKDPIGKKKKHGPLVKQDTYDEVGEDDVDKGDKTSLLNKKDSKLSLRKYFTDKGRFQTVRVSIPDSDDEDYAYHPIMSMPSRKANTMKTPRTLSQDPSSLSPQEVELRAENILTKTLEDNFVKLMMNKSVTAVDLGYREKKGNLTKLRCIKIWVRKKIDEEDVHDKEYIPKMIDGSPVDKVEGNGHLLAAEEAWLLFWRKKRAIGKIKHEAKDHVDLPFLVRSAQTTSPPVESLKGGHSIGRQKNQLILGTLGYFVWRKNEKGILTTAQIAGGIGTKIVSPAWRDKKEGTKVVAMTTLCINSEEVDCAFALLTGIMLPSSRFRDDTVVTGTARVNVGDLVKYYGAGTRDMTMALVEKVDWEGEIDGLYWRNQIQLSIPTLPGDSGAILLKADTHEAVGMIFANVNRRAIANHIDKILSEMDAQIALS